MGHASVTNLSQLFIRHLYAKGEISINDIIEFAKKKGETVHASEGNHDDEGTLGMVFEEIAWHLLQNHQWSPVDEPCPVIEPADSEHHSIYRKWVWQEEMTGEEIKLIDALKWRFAPGWRKRYPNIPILRTVEN